MAGPLSSERPVEGAHTTGPGTWSEPTKDFQGVYRGKSKTRGQAPGGTVGLGGGGATGQSAFAGVSTARANVREKSIFKKRLRK